MTYCKYSEDKQFKEFIDYFSKLSEEEKKIIIKLFFDYI